MGTAAPAAPFEGTVRVGMIPDLPATAGAWFGPLPVRALTSPPMGVPADARASTGAPVALFAGCSRADTSVGTLEPEGTLLVPPPAGAPASAPVG